jgi:AraC-like DNA-binding protein
MNQQHATAPMAASHSPGTRAFLAVGSPALVRGRAVPAQPSSAPRIAGAKNDRAPPGESLSVSNALVTATLEGLSLDETEEAALLEAAGLTVASVRDPTGRIPILGYAHLWHQALRLTDDPFVGLAIGRSVRGERFGLASHAASHSANFRQVLLRLSKYAPLINDLLECTLSETARVASFSSTYRRDLLDLERHAADLTFSVVVTWARQHLGGTFAVKEVRLKHRSSFGRNVYESFFAAPVRFGCARSELLFDSALLDQPVREADVQLGAILERYASEEIVSQPVLGDLPARVLQLLHRELRAGRVPSLNQLCLELRLPARQVQRKLRQRSTSYRALLDSARASLAPSLLDEPGGSVSQVAFALGYAHPTGFIRAFKKWFGRTPGQHRASGHR